jgi:hypothetical protein
MYRDHYGYQSLNEELIQQYQVQDEDLHGLLLSPRAKLNDKGYQCCSSCKLSLASQTEACPQYSIANGFPIEAEGNGLITNIICWFIINSIDCNNKAGTNIIYSIRY